LKAVLSFYFLFISAKSLKSHSKSWVPGFVFFFFI
jgi:hypothetical protein